MLRAANKNLYDCRWQSYRYYAGATSVATDEVEAENYHHEMVLRCYLRPHPSRAMARDTFPSRGRLFLCPISPCVDFYCSNIPGWRAGHAAAPTKPRREISGKSEITPPQSPLATAPPTQGSLTQSGRDPTSFQTHSPSHALQRDSPLMEGAKAAYFAFCEALQGPSSPFPGEFFLSRFFFDKLTLKTGAKCVTI